MAESDARLPLSALAATYLHSLPSVAGLSLAGVLYAARPQLWPGSWALVLIGVLLAARLLHPLVRWATLRYEVTPDHLRLTTGVFVRRSRTSTWKRLAVVDTEEPWAYRLFGLAIVTARSGGEDDTVLTLPGVDSRLATRLAEESRDAINRGAPDLAPRSEVNPRELVYRATATELIIASVAYGQFLVVGIGVVAGAVDLLDTIGARNGALGIFEAGPVIWAVIVGIGIVGIGLVLTLVRFHGFEVYCLGDRFAISYGLLSRHERFIDHRAVVGVQSQRNFVEMLFDRVRVSLFTTDTAAQVGSNLVLPSLPRGTAAIIVSAALSEIRPTTILATTGRRSLARTIAAAFFILGIPVASIAATRPTGIPLGFAIAGAALAVVLITAVARLVTGRLEFDDERVILRTHHLIEREEVVRLDAVHLVSSLSTRRYPDLMVRAHFFAGAPRAFTTIRDGGAGRRLANALPQTAAANAAAKLSRERPTR